MKSFSLMEHFISFKYRVSNATGYSLFFVISHNVHSSVYTRGRAVTRSHRSTTSVTVPVETRAQIFLRTCAASIEGWSIFVMAVLKKGEQRAGERNEIRHRPWRYFTVPTDQSRCQVSGAVHSQLPLQIEEAPFSLDANFQRQCDIS